jgi:hypothetical protein
MAQVQERLRMAAERARSEPQDIVTVAAVALYLQNFYTSIEEPLKRIASDVDGTLPGGEEWHRELLRQLAADLPDVRPAVLDGSLVADLDLLRRFRHLVRHAYVADYRWSEMEPVLSVAERVRERMPEAMEKFGSWVRETIERLESPE